MEPQDTNLSQTIQEAPAASAGTPNIPLQQEPDSLLDRLLKNRLFLFFTIAASIMIPLMLGLFIGNANSKTITQTKKIYRLTNTTNPVIPIETINNQMFSDWSGRVKGRIKKVNGDTFDISAIEELFTNAGIRAIKDSKNPNLTTIRIIPGSTQFFSYEYSTDSAELVANKVNKSVGDLVNGDIIEGTVKIEYDNNSKETVLVGASFAVRKAQ